MRMEKYIESFGWTLFEKALRILLGFFVSAAVAKYLGPSQHGTLAIAVGLVAIFCGSAGMGAEHININQIVLRKNSNPSIFITSALLTRLLWSGFCLVCLYAYVTIVNSDYKEICLILSALVPLAAFSIYINQMQAIGAFRFYAIASLISMSCGAAARVYGIFSEGQINYFAAVLTVESVILISLVGAGLVMLIGKSEMWSCPDPQQMLEYFRKCLPTALSVALVAIFLRTELFIVAHVEGRHAAGQWAAASMLIGPWSMVAASILPIVNKEISHHQLNGGDLQKYYIKLIRVMMLLAVFAIVVNWVAVLTLVPLLLGDKYDDSYLIMILMSFGIPFVFMGAVQDIWIAQHGKTSVVLKKVILGLPISIFLLYLLVGKFSLIGAAVSMLLSYASTTIVMNIAFDRKYFHLQMKALGLSHG